MAYLEELLPEFRKGAKIRCDYWDEGKYIKLKEDGYIYDDNDDRIEFSSLTIFGKSWQLYKEPELDWDYIIKNKCLCWFWCDDNDGKYLGTIRFINKNDELPFMNWERGYAKNCRPVRRDEVTFYEDRKDD